MSKDTFHLGITMAGAVSAGCYTAGVMDYFLEVLDLWEKAKAGQVPEIDDNLTPKHNVVIDAIGGCSAGGMSSVITGLYALKGKINPVKTNDDKDNLSPKNNLLYDSWVLLLDEEKKETFDKLWDLSDIKNEGVKSLLNSDFVSEIADKVLKVDDNEKNLETYVQKNLPSYISPDLQILLSHSIFNGVKLPVAFGNDISRDHQKPRHITSDHYFVSHFKLNKGKPIENDDFLWFNPLSDTHSSVIKTCTIATGAFPVGLKYKVFNKGMFSKKYIQSMVIRNLLGDFSIENPSSKHPHLVVDVEVDFMSATVDGGAINNEPYREVESLIKKHHDDNAMFQNYGLVMIDPFPDDIKSLKEYENPENLVECVPKIIKMLWNQAKVKRQELVESSEIAFTKGLIYPKKWNRSFKGVQSYPLFSKAFHAFGGFLDIEIRKHDFFLGRNNARNFIRYFASFPYDPENGIVHDIHKNWTPEMVDKFKIFKSGNMFLPIIPDMNMVLNNENSRSKADEYTITKSPRVSAKKIIGHEKMIKKRLSEILKLVIDDAYDDDKKANTKKSEEKKNLVTKMLMDKAFKKTLIGKAKASLLEFALKRKASRNSVAAMMAEELIKSILKDLENMGILKDDYS